MEPGFFHAASSPNRKMPSRRTIHLHNCARYPFNIELSTHNCYIMNVRDPAGINP